MNKKTTIDELAVLMEKGFKRQDKRTDEVLEAMNKFAVSVDKRFDGVDKRFDGVDKRFDKIEAEIVDIKEEIRQIRIDLKQIWSKLEEIEQKLGKVSGMAKEDADALGSEVLDLRQRVNFLEKQIKELQTA